MTWNFLKLAFNRGSEFNDENNAISYPLFRLIYYYQSSGTFYHMKQKSP